jgi:amino acid adenylation domain-containing protein
MDPPGDVMSTPAQGSALSPQQRHVWRLQADSRAYRSQCVVSLDGGVDSEALRRALAAVTDRHEALCTVFHRAPGVRFPLQSAASAGAAAAPMWQQADLADRADRAQGAEVDELLRQAARRPFDFERGPLLFATLVTLGAGRRLLLLTLPALVADRASLRNLVRDLAAAYAAPHDPWESSGEAVRYVEFAGWQNELLASEPSRPGREFWRQQDRPALRALRLPAEGGPGAGGFAPERIAVPLSPAVAGRVESFASAAGVPVAVVLLAAWQVLLWKLTGEAEAGVGVVLDGRRHDDLRDAVGLFARWAPLAFRLREGEGFRDRVARVRDDWQEAMDWQDCFAAGDGELAASGLPACFEYAELEGEWRAGDLVFALERSSCYGERFKVCLMAGRRRGALALELHYDGRLYAAAAAQALAARLEPLLASLSARPDGEIGRAEVLTAAERQQIARWNDTAAHYPEEGCLHERIAAQAARTPAAEAVSCAGATLTYRQLDERAERLAAHLQELGVGVETRVGICLERALELVVALLAVLKAGGCYVPLDPAYPAERLAYMLRDSAVPVLLTQQALLQSLAIPAATGPVAGSGGLPRVVCLDSPWEETAPRAARESGVEPGNLAYVIYTSGSTGEPKGAMNTHRGIVNRLLWMQETYRLTAADRVLQKTPLSFDVSVWELFWPLLAGARLVVARPGGHQDPAYLVDVLARAGITTAHFVPSMLQAFLEADGVERATALKRVICSGEALPEELVERFFSRLGAELHNLYGPTEAAVDVTAWACERGGGAGVAIGRPVANTEIRLLDSALCPVPIGVPGELYIGGVQVGRGYLGRPALTAERFVPDPFAISEEGPGERLYRSGDLARYRADGAIEYLGRRDYQVKVRGFRVELGEVEAALRSHPGVRDAAVAVRAGGPGEKRLVAYLVAAREPAPNVDELRSYLGAKLPDFMVPALFVPLAALPLTANGKLDRAALPEPGSERPQLEREYVAPRNPLEQALAEIWGEVLGFQKIGVLDSFFALGGDSIRSVRVVALGKERGLELTVDQLFRQRTIEALAADLAAAGVVPTGGDAGRESEEALARLVAELEGLSEQEALARLKEQLAAFETEGTR